MYELVSSSSLSLPLKKTTKEKKNNKNNNNTEQVKIETTTTTRTTTSLSTPMLEDHSKDCRDSLLLNGINGKAEANDDEADGVYAAMDSEYYSDDDGMNNSDSDDVDGVEECGGGGRNKRGLFHNVPFMSWLYYGRNRESSHNNNNNNNNNNINNNKRRRRRRRRRRRGGEQNRRPPFHWTPIKQRYQIMYIRRKCGYALAITTFLAFLIIIPLFSIIAVRDRHLREDYAAFYSSGAFVLLTVPISIREIYMHLTNWFMPDVQKYVVRILWMVPLYSIQSWLSLRFNHELNLSIDTIRDLYEAFVIQSFLYYLVEILGGEDVLAATLRMKGDDSHGEHGWLLERLCKFRKWEMGRDFMYHCKYGVLQYVVIKTFSTLCAALLPQDLYGNGKFDLTKGYAYMAIATNFSQMYALYCLVKLFYATKQELYHPINWKPIGKFCCVKGVVFFTWWQGLGIVILQNYGIIGDVGSWNADDVATGIQDYLVCVEMLFFAIAHMYTFTYKEYCGGYNRSEDYNVFFRGIDSSPSYYSSSSSLDGRGVGVGVGVAAAAANADSAAYYNNRDKLINNENDEYDDDYDNGGGGGGGGDIVDDVDNDEDYQAPLVRKLEAPMNFSQAFWSSTVPMETLSDIAKLTTSTTSKNGKQHYYYGRPNDVYDDTICVKNAESI